METFGSAYVASIIVRSGEDNEGERLGYEFALQTDRRRLAT